MRSGLIGALAALAFGISAVSAVGQDDISVVSSGDARVEAFFMAADPEGGVFHVWQLNRDPSTPSKLGAWSLWERFGPTPDAGSQIVSARGTTG